MRGTIYNEKIKNEAEQLRKAGISYGDIKKTLNIPKSTLSVWFSKKFPYKFDKKAQAEHLKNIRPLAMAAKKKRTEEEARNIQEKIGQEIKKYPLTNIGFLKSILAGLYWAEGAKYKGVSGLKFVNTDPNLTHLYITLLRKCYDLDEGRFRIKLHLHYYHNKKEGKNFWSKLLNIPETQFANPYIKKRSKKRRFRKNFMGICFINYLNSNIRKELLELGKQLHENIIK